MRRTRHAKIVATLGPASADYATICSLFEAGADVFRLNFSHGSHEQHKERLDIIRRVEREAFAATATSPSSGEGRCPRISPAAEVGPSGARTGRATVGHPSHLG